MEYKVLPFVATIATQGTSNQVAQQLEEMIQKHSYLGWKYLRLESVTTFVQPENGCFGIGAKPGYTTSRQMLVFTK